MPRSWRDLTAAEWRNLGISFVAGVTLLTFAQAGAFAFLGDAPLRALGIGLPGAVAVQLYIAYLKVRRPELLGR